jgi:outer membrane protein TolC
VKLSDENLRLSRVRYEGGEGPALDVVLAQAQLVQARTNFYVVRANYLIALADLEVARGQ